MGAVAVPATAGSDQNRGTIELVSARPDGGSGGSAPWPGYEKETGLSGDGRYVVFSSHSTDLVPNDTNGQRDVFVRDTQTGRTTLVSVGADGVQGNRESRQGSISADGRFVAFNSLATNLLPGDTNDSPDVFRRDLLTGRTTLVSGGRAGQSDRGAHQPEISADGRQVAFTSESTNLIAGDTNNVADVFVRDLAGRRTERVSLTGNGRQSADPASQPTISGDGRVVAFTFGTTKVAVRDRGANTTRVISQGVPVYPIAGEFEAGKPAISTDGRFVVFTIVGYWPGRDPVPNVWLRDLRTDRLEHISVNYQGQPADNIDGSFRNDISADGRYVTYSSTSRLTRLDGGGLSDVYRLDRRTGSLDWITADQEQSQIDNNNGSFAPAISDDGHHVAFASDARDLFPGGGPGYDTYRWSSR